MTIFEPEKPCRVMATRGCPILRAAGCPGEPCARYESDDEAPWAADARLWEQERGRDRAASAYQFMFMTPDDDLRAREWSSSLGVLERIALSLGPHEFLRLGPGTDQLGIITAEVRPCSPE